MPQDKKPGHVKREQELSAAREALSRLRHGRARNTAAGKRQIERAQAQVEQAERALRRQQNIAEGKDAIPRAENKSAQDRVRERRAAEREVGVERGRP